MTEVTYDSEMQINDNNQALESILQTEPYKKALSETLSRISNREEFADAFDKLTSLQNKNLPSRPFTP